jgi:hypothetical protein
MARKRRSKGLGKKFKAGKKMITAKQKAARRRNMAVARKAKRKSPAQKLGMTEKDLARIPGTKAHAKASLKRAGTFGMSKASRRRVANIFFRNSN